MRTLRLSWRLVTWVHAARRGQPCMRDFLPRLHRPAGSSVLKEGVCSEEGAVISLPLCGVPPRVTFVLAVDAPFGAMFILMPLLLSSANSEGFPHKGFYLT